MENIKSILAELRKMKNIALILIFVGLVLFSYKPLITKVVEKKINDPVKEDINNNVLIQQMLNNLMIKYGADRGYIFQFHNTIKYYDGSHRNHQSMTFEVCSNGISREAQYLQNLAVSLYPVFLQDVLLDRMNYNNIDEIKEEATKINLKNQGIKSIYITPYFKNGKFVAYIGIDFVKKENETQINKQEFKSITNEIGNTLML
ncbi:hypothetical protein UFOVP622_33 [uncultured Caudovirales phage]|uniref:Uncharacterized protein n=1 Tax=uncultured Caudovirales phage TaxID=2100421 RepID=A0A6J5N3U7_9CAUD|nr:hypothetical protein UFOVP622_33 [uncultured Caudovirales phage]